MRLLLSLPESESDSPLAAALLRVLAPAHDLRLLPDPRDRAATTDALTDRDAAVCVVPPPAGPDHAQLAALDRASRGVFNLLTALDPPAALPRLVLVTSLRPFDRYPPGWWVDETWAPRPTTDLADLAPYLAELTAREVTRVRRTEVVVLRLDQVTAPAADSDGPVDRRWLHPDDAVQAIERALALPFLAADGTGDRWRVYHIGDGGAGARFPPTRAAAEELGYAPRHRLTASLPAPTGGEEDRDPVPPPPEMARRPPRRVVLFGAGGPLGAVAAAGLARDPGTTLRLTDVRPMAELVAGPPQSPGAPLPRPLGPPHEEVVVDVTDPDEVAAAVAGMDAILNLTVIRRDPVAAFRVNLLGAYHLARAAVDHGVRRLVHTGPIQTILDHPAGYGADFALSPEAPPRPGDDLYFLSKFLGQEVTRLFAAEHGLEVPCLLFGNFVDPATPPAADDRLYPFTLSWDDAGDVLRRAVLVPSLPRPFEVLHPNADLPHGRYPNEKAKTLLGWQPRDRLASRWRG